MSEFHYHRPDGEEFSEDDIERMYVEFLDDVYGMVRIAGMEFDTSRALQEIDPIAFRCGMLDYMDSEEMEECFTDHTEEEN